MKRNERDEHQRHMIRLMVRQGFPRRMVADCCGVHHITVSRVASWDKVKVPKVCACGRIAVDRYRGEDLCADCLNAPGDPTYEERQREFYTRRNSSLAAMQDNAPPPRGVTTKTKFAALLDEQMAKRGIKIDRGIAYGRVVE